VPHRRTTWPKTEYTEYEHRAVRLLGRSYCLGIFEEYPDYRTQGESLEDLQDHLKDLFSDLTKRRDTRSAPGAELPSHEAAGLGRRLEEKGVCLCGAAASTMV